MTLGGPPRPSRRRGPPHPPPGFITRGPGWMGGGGARASVWPKPRGLAAPRECDPLPLSASAWGSRPPSFPALLPVHCQSPLVLTRPVGAVKLVKDGPQVWGQADLCSGLSAVGLPLPLLASGVSSVKGGCCEYERCPSGRPGGRDECLPLLGVTGCKPGTQAGRLRGGCGLEAGRQGG